MIFTMTVIRMLGIFFVFCFSFASSEEISDPKEVCTDNLRKLASANNELAFNLYRKLVSNSTGNVFFSPLSISTVLGMLFYGTRGDSAEELRKALGFEKADLSTDLVHETFSHFLVDVLNAEDSSTGYILKAANAAIIDKHFEVLDKYKSNVAELYKASVINANILTEAPEIVEGVNSWVKAKTNGQIGKFLDDLSPSTSMILLNAVYFKGTWKTQFEPEESTEQIFLNNGLESEGKEVPMMHMTSRLMYDSIDDFQALELPYKGENVSMFLLLPDENDGLLSLEDSLTPEKLVEIQEKLEETKIDVSLPKFKLEFEKELSEEMQALGANKIFSSDADFSGMTPNKGMFVSEIRHKAIIEVNEEGSESSAATGNLIDRMKSPHFRADHPFFFAIVEKSSNMILFMGHVNNL